MERFFSADLPCRQWREFSASGFEEPACGVIFAPGDAICGLPLGGIGTGCMDLNPDGTLGRCSIFNSFVPPRELDQPFLALAAEGRVWTLASRAVPETAPAEIHYWGHYPVADLEFGLDGPVQVGLRAWSPFVLGDAPASNTPAACFEFRIRNQGSTTLSGSLVLSFPGPSERESSGVATSRILHGELSGIEVRCPAGDYVLARTGRAAARVGGALRTPEAWRHCADKLPPPEGLGATLAVDFALEPGAEERAWVILAWHFQRWQGSEAHHYRHAYARRFPGAIQVAEHMARNGGCLLKRTLGWQAAIYGRRDWPVWLRDQLVNVLHTITEDSFWAAESIPPDNWYGSPGLFGLTESPRTTPHICNPSDWYGSLPVTFFFPELMGALLRSYAHFQLGNGEVPLGIGEGADLARPTYHLLHILNSCVHIHLIDRLWQRTGDSAVLREFYPSAKQALAYMETLDRDGDGLPELDPDPVPNQFYGAWRWTGTATHVNGLWLAALSMVERMAAAYGDSATAQRCRLWRAKAGPAQENLWAGPSYLLYRASGAQSDTVLANQLAGEWCARLHGLGGLFAAPHVATALAAVDRLCGRPDVAGLLNAARRNGDPDLSGHPQSDAIFTGECLCAVATMAYAGMRDVALEAGRRLFTAIVLETGRAWDLPNLVDARGWPIHGTDFYQNMILWALPLAVDGSDIAGACGPDGWATHLLQAASVKSTPDARI